MKALVIRKKAFSESDLIVDFLLEDGQISSGFAMAARKSRRRFPHQFYFGALYELSWAPASLEHQLKRIQSCEVIESHPQYIENIDLFSRWSTVLEWIYTNKLEPHSFEQIYQLLSSLPSQKGLLNYYLYFIEEVKRHGLSPRLDRCIVCHKEVAEIYFSLSDGGISHGKCKQGIELSSKIFNFLKIAFSDQPNDLSGFSLLTEDSKTLDQVVLPFLEWQLGQTLKSRQFLFQTSHPAQRRAPETALNVFSKSLR